MLLASPALPGDTSGNRQVWKPFAQLIRNPELEATYGAAVSRYGVEEVEVDIAGRRRRSFQVRGDGWLCYAGIGTVVRGTGFLEVSFTYKAESDSPESCVTNVCVLVVDRKGKVLAGDTPVAGGVQKTEWRSYRGVFDFGSTPQPADVTVAVCLNDGWIASRSQQNWYADVRVRRLYEKPQSAVVRVARSS